MKTEDQLLWKENAPVLVQRSDREEQKRKWSISLWMECGPTSWWMGRSSVEEGVGREEVCLWTDK
jgi:hypothetical protein